ncbi:uncharacterized protein LOC110053194 isoform X2 [Orbicella faveolata]|uniref:uncharacterized protein LOC110053194 isoform X2 n=1 Tax=Orbicella faveolata TaxID=48498 RepID=UPI0009E62DC6|nr:uncharacterized protein LOC110053194 isoform X2 [Orbicella faveolata]
MSPHGLGEESNLPSRTNEVVRCEERLLASCRGENTSLPSFLVHSFDELCWQARTLTMAICIVLLNPRKENAGVREGIVRALRWLSAQYHGKGLFYWPGETSSTDGRRVCNMFGVRYTSDAVLVIVPSSSSMWKPTLLDGIEDSSITATNIEDRLATALEKATDMLKVLSIQREKLETFRRDRAEQEDDLLKAQQNESNERREGEEKEKEKVGEEQKLEDNDTEEKDARSARRARVNEEPVSGNVIRVRSRNGTQERRFQTGAHFQVRSRSN